MAKLYTCLRNCFVGSRFYTAGERYELPDELVKSEKNFRLVRPPAKKKRRSSKKRTAKKTAADAPKAKASAPAENIDTSPSEE